MEPKIKRVLLVRPNYQVSAASLERTLTRMNSELQNGSVVLLLSAVFARSRNRKA
jgi:hypothetical protein